MSYDLEERGLSGQERCRGATLAAMLQRCVNGSPMRVAGIVGPGHRGFEAADQSTVEVRDGGCTATTSAAAPNGSGRGSGSEQRRKQGYENRDSRRGTGRGVPGDEDRDSWRSRGGNDSAGGAARLTALRKALTIGFANRIARRMRMHNGYRTVNAAGQLAQLHPGSSHLHVDEEGLLPEWVIYHELVATSRPFLRQVSMMGGAGVSS
jgi:hypothetical protein